MPYDIIESMNNRITGAMSEREMPDGLTRDIGGFSRTNQPYINGYFQVIFSLPQKLFTSEAATAVNLLHTTAETFTPHTQTMDKIDLVGQGKIGSSFPASTTVTREFTLAFREYQNLPILNTIRTWASMFDPHIGVSPLKGSEMIPLSYKGACYVIMTKPSMGDQNQIIDPENIEEIFAYDGVFPTTVPYDILNQDVNTNDSIQNSVTFSFDGFPLTIVDGGQELVSKVQNLLNDKQYMRTFDHTFNDLVK